MAMATVRASRTAAGAARTVAASGARHSPRSLHFRTLSTLRRGTLASSTTWRRPTPGPSSSVRQYASEASTSASATSSDPASDLRQIIADIDASLLAAPFPVDPSLPLELSLASLALSSSSDSPRTIAIAGDVRSGAGDLVTALLDDPLATDREASRLIRSRRELVGKDEPAVRLSYGPEARFDPVSSTIFIPLVWLKTHNLSILDVFSPSHSSTASLLVSSHLPVLVLDDVRLLPPRLASLTTSVLGHHPLASICLNRVSSRTGQAEESYEAAATLQLRSQLSKLISRESGLRIPDIFSVDSSLALTGIKALSSSSASSSSSTRFIAQSGLSGVRSRIETSLSSNVATIAPAVASASRAVSLLASSLILDTTRTSSAETLLEAYRIQVAELKSEALSVVTSEEGEDGAGGRKEVERVFGRCLKWWKLAWKVDDVGWLLRNAIEGSYGKTLENQLAFTAGLLANFSHRLSLLTSTLLSSPLFSSARPGGLPPAFPTAVLSNLVSQRALPPTFFRRDLLTEPLAWRKAQLLSRGGPIDAVHRQAQLLLVEFSALSAGSSLLAGFGYLGSQFSLSSAVGIGALGAATAGWRLQGRWKRKGQGRFWREWERVEKGLKGDLEDGGRQVVEGNMFLPATTVLETLGGMIRTRQDGLEIFRVKELRPLVAKVERASRAVRTEEKDGHAAAGPEGGRDLAWARETVDQGFGREVVTARPSTTTEASA